MYQPPHFQETRPDILHGLIRAHPLGLLISNGAEGPVADAIPFLLDAEFAPNGRLRAHLAKANPHWRLLAEQPTSPVLIVFQGADAYVTPSWYETKRETGKVVPTWNYAIVQVRGTVRVIEDQDWLAQQISDLTVSQEGGRAAPWAVTDAPASFIQSQIKGIVGMEIEITDISGKWKVSQNRPVADRVGVADGLENEGPERKFARHGPTGTILGRHREQVTGIIARPMFQDRSAATVSSAFLPPRHRPRFLFSARRSQPKSFLADRQSRRCPTEDETKPGKDQCGDDCKGAAEAETGDRVARIVRADENSRRGYARGNHQGDVPALWKQQPCDPEYGAHGRGMAGRKAGKARIKSEGVQGQNAKIMEIGRARPADCIFQQIDGQAGEANGTQH